MLKVVFIAVQKHTENNCFDNKILQLTRFGQEWLSDLEYPVVTVNSYNEISQYMDADLLVVQTAGDIVFERDHFWQKILNIPDDVGLIGHLIWYPHEDGPYLHHQCFIIRTAALANSSIDFSTGEDEGREFTRSIEDMHGNHAPLWIGYSDNIVKRKLGFGTRLLATILDNGYKLSNFDTDWRFPNISNYNEELMSDKLKEWMRYFNFPCIGTRGYCYPEENSEEFSEAIRTLDSSREINELQKLFVEFFKSIVNAHEKIVNLFHCDFPANKPTAKKIISPSNGLFGEIEAYTKHAEEIIFYDINKNNIDFKRDLYTYWDGNNYKEFAENWANSRGLTIEPRWKTSVDLSKRHIEQYQLIEDNWEDVKKIKKEFFHIDIIRDYQQIIDQIEENTILYTSTILSYYPASNISHSSETISNVRILLKDKINLTNSVWAES